MEIEVNEVIKRKIEVFPCIKCSSDNIEIYNCNYSSFNCAGGKCKKCGHKVETGDNWNVKNSVLVGKWNEENDPDVLIERLEKNKAKIVEEIKVLKKIKSKKTIKTK